MRPYNRSLHSADYDFLPHAEELRQFEGRMQANGVPRREWHPHRFWEYASIMQQLGDLGVPADAEIVDVGAGASFFDPYLALRYPRLCCTDSMKYGDVTDMVNAQRAYFGIDMPLYDLTLEDMPADWTNHFDVTMCISTIEHVDDHDTAFEELVRITKPGGYIFITSDYFKSVEHWEVSISKHLQVTPYREEFVLDIPNRFGVEFVGPTDLAYQGDFVHNYSFVNICLRKPA